MRHLVNQPGSMNHHQLFVLVPREQRAKAFRFQNIAAYVLRISRRRMVVLPQCPAAPVIIYRVAMLLSWTAHTLEIFMWPEEYLESLTGCFGEVRDEDLDEDFFEEDVEFDEEYIEDVPPV